MAAQKTLHLIASKLGVSENDKVVSKAAEFERLLQSKAVAGNIITDTAKVVICLDLAAYFLGIDLDVKNAIKYSGLKSPSYMSSRKTIENLLEINTERLTPASLCLSLQCMGVQPLAEKILEDYQNKSKMKIDLNLPQYVCIAVYHACRLSKEKISKAKLIEKSRLKSSQWAKLDAEWSKFVDENMVAAVKRKGRPLKNPVIEEDVNNEKMEVNLETKNEVLEPEIEPYDDWKKRVLESAYKELREMEKIGMKIEKSGTPRRSPRKTPQKFSPYKESPNKAKGVRLLFPLS